MCCHYRRDFHFVESRHREPRNHRVPNSFRRRSWFGHPNCACYSPRPFNFRSNTLTQPLIAIMAVLPPEDVSLGTTVAVFSQFFGGGIFLAISENIFANQLVKKLAEYAPQVNPLTIIQAGATGLRDFISEDNLPPVLESYNEAITTTFVS